MKTKFKVGDKVRTNQDHYEIYDGTIVDIYEAPHPYRSSDKFLKWYRISYPFREGTFITCDLKYILA